MQQQTREEARSTGVLMGYPPEQPQRPGNSMPNFAARRKGTQAQLLVA